MATAVWDNGTWSVSNGGLTATSPNNNTQGAINEENASIAIPNNAKTYFEFKVSGAALLTAFGVGFGIPGSNDGGYDPSHVVSSSSVPNGAAETEFGYNRGITEGHSVVYDPEGNVADHNAGRSPAPNSWSNGAVIGVEVDRIDKTATFFLNGQQQGPPVDIAAMGNETLFPMVSSWFKAGPQATLIGDPTKTPAEYTNLDELGRNPKATAQPPPPKTPPPPPPATEPSTPPPTPPKTPP